METKFYILKSIEQIILELSSLFFVILVFYMIPAGMNNYRILSLMMTLIALALIIVIFQILKNKRSENVQKTLARLVFVFVIICLVASLIFLVFTPVISGINLLVGLMFWILLILGVYRKQTPENPVFEERLRDYFGWLARM